MLVLFRFVDEKHKPDTKMVEVDKPANIEPYFYAKCGWKSKIIWFLPKCGTVDWKVK